MKLVYKDTQDRVLLGDMVTLSDGEEVRVLVANKPHKPSSSGKVTVENVGSMSEYYVGVIGAEWIEREDR